MERRVLEPRAGWRDKVAALGLVWHSDGDDRPYWNEGACYVFTSEEIAVVEEATASLYDLFLKAGDHVVDNNLFARFAIPEWCWPLIAEAWRNEPPALNHGRFDLGWTGEGAPKLFEFNCDTPTSLLEAAVVQWDWKQDRFADLDQFNGIHDALVAKWADIKGLLDADVVHFTHADEASGEDAVTTAYLLDTAAAAGLTGRPILISDIGWDGTRFLDLEMSEIRTLCHLYPWEWMAAEDFGPAIGMNAGRTRFIEPIWKMIWSNKAILEILWELFPGHPNLLWASSKAPLGENYVRKPLLAREGANIEIFRSGRRTAGADGPYAADPAMFQELYTLPVFDGVCPVLGSWVVDGAPAGLGIREDGLITGNLARFVPHVIARPT